MRRLNCVLKPGSMIKTATVAGSASKVGPQTVRLVVFRVELVVTDHCCWCFAGDEKMQI